MAEIAPHMSTAVDSEGQGPIKLIISQIHKTLLWPLCQVIMGSIPVSKCKTLQLTGAQCMEAANTNLTEKVLSGKASSLIASESSSWL